MTWCRVLKEFRKEWKQWSDRNGKDAPLTYFTVSSCIASLTAAGKAVDTICACSTIEACSRCTIVNIWGKNGEKFKYTFKSSSKCPEGFIICPHVTGTLLWAWRVKTIEIQWIKAKVFHVTSRKSLKVNYKAYFSHLPIPKLSNKYEIVIDWPCYAV